MWTVDENETTDHLTKKLEQEWNKLANNYIKQNRIKYEEFKRSNQQTVDEQLRIVSNLIFC